MINEKLQYTCPLCKKKSILKQSWIDPAQFKNLPIITKIFFDSCGILLQAKVEFSEDKEIKILKIERTSIEIKPENELVISPKNNKSLKGSKQKRQSDDETI